MFRQIIKLIQIMAILVFVVGCSQPDGHIMQEPVSETLQNNQAGVIVAIDRLVDQFYSGVYEEDEIILELQKVIPKPANFPEEPIEFIVPGGEGGSIDNYARNLGRDASLIMGQNIYFNNLPGGRGEVGLAYLLQARPDGYTIFAASVEQTINEVLGRQAHSFSKNVEYIIRSQNSVEAYWVVFDSPFRTIEDVFEYAVNNPEKLTVSGHGSPGDGQFKVLSLAGELGTQIGYVANDNAVARMELLLEREVDLLLESAGNAEEFYKNNKIRPLAYSGDLVFSDIDPDLPSIKNLGFKVPLTRWKGIVTAKGVNSQIIEYLHNCFYAASKLPYYQTYEDEFRFYICDAYLNPNDFKAYVFEEVKLLNRLARDH